MKFNVLVALLGASSAIKVRGPGSGPPTAATSGPPPQPTQTKGEQVRSFAKQMFDQCDIDHSSVITHSEMLKCLKTVRSQKLMGYTSNIKYQAQQIQTQANELAKYQIEVATENQMAEFNFEQQNLSTLIHTIFTGAAKETGGSTKQIGGINMHQTVKFIGNDWVNIQAIMNAPPPAPRPAPTAAGGPGGPPPYAGGPGGPPPASSGPPQCSHSPVTPEPLSPPTDPTLCLVPNAWWFLENATGGCEWDCVPVGTQPPPPTPPAAGGPTGGPTGEPTGPPQCPHPPTSPEPLGPPTGQECPPPTIWQWIQPVVAGPCEWQCAPIPN